MSPLSAAGPHPPAEVRGRGAGRRPHPVEGSRQTQVAQCEIRAGARLDHLLVSGSQRDTPYDYRDFFGFFINNYFK